MTRIRNRFGTYWARQFQYRIIAACRGILAANIADNGGDMVVDLAIENGNAATDANRIGATSVIEAVFTMGDAFDALRAMAVHSNIYKRLVTLQLIDFVKDQTRDIMIPTYLGKRIIVDDGLPAIAGTTSGFKFVSIMFGANAIGYGEGSPKVPAELERLPSSGMGGGLENLWERKTWLIHPGGWNWTEDSVANVSPALAELRLAANWERVLSRKQVPMAFLLTNG